ncbi:MAG: TetR/AcrR family transcriptional regulator [Pseudomonadaceae bacterium]|nr:TetR/AcrR family transcriptional regulator [Pseudomonadaceae bacterium]
MTDVELKEPDSGKRAAILAGAETQFSQYGFRRTSMEDIARQVGISRASLYSYFDNKEAIFRGLTVALYEESIASAAGELSHDRGEESLDVRLLKGLCGFYRRLFGVLESSPHGADIIEASSRLSADIVQTYYERIEKLLAAELTFAADSGEVDLKAMGLSAKSGAEMLRLSSAGLKQGSQSFAEYEKKLAVFLPLLFAGFTHR